MIRGRARRRRLKGADESRGGVWASIDRELLGIATFQFRLESQQSLQPRQSGAQGVEITRRIWSWDWYWYWYWNWDRDRGCNVKSTGLGMVTYFRNVDIGRYLDSISRHPILPDERRVLPPQSAPSPTFQLHIDEKKTRV